MNIQVIVGSLALFGLVASAILYYYIPRRLSEERLKGMEKLLHPFSKAAGPFFLIFLFVLGVSRLLIGLGYLGLGYQESVNWFLVALAVVAFTLLAPAAFGRWGAYGEVTKRQRKEEKEARKEELARLLKS